MEKGSIYEILIHDMSHEGKGIGRADGIAVFVDGAVPGDRVEAEITKVKKNYAFARTMKIVEESEYRIEPVCEYSSMCGGCTYSCLDYSAQLKFKRKQVKDKLERIGKITDAKVNEMEGLDSPFRYRNKAEFPVREDIVGFFMEKSHDVSDIPDCLLQSIPAMAAAEGLRREGNSHIRHLVTRTAFGTGQVMVVLVADSEDIDNLEDIIYSIDDRINELDDEYYYLESVYLNVRGRNDKNHMGEKFICVAGRSAIVEDTGRLQFEISPASFYQVNPVQMEKLYSKAVEYMNLTGSETVLDLYCGVGTIGLYAAGKAAKIIGIESVKDAVIDANRNAVINHIVNARYITGKAEEVLPKLIAGEYENKGIICERADVAVIDPPRSGCAPELLDTLAQTGPDRIVYVSCDPATLARDVRILTEKGYEFVEATPVDMFPWTSHVETCVLLSHKSADDFISVKMEYADDRKIQPDRITYRLIQEYIEEKYGFKVHTANIAEVKRNLGLPMYDAPNAVEELKRPYKPAPEYKVEAIKDALRHFKVID